jgi:hypothetical protein
MTRMNADSVAAKRHKRRKEFPCRAVVVKTKAEWTRMNEDLGTQISHETLTFLESLTGRPTTLRLINAESLKNIEAFARDNLEPEFDLIPEPFPVRSGRKYGRNEKVSVRYNDGTVKKDVKFKKVESDLVEKRCTLVEG